MHLTASQRFVVLLGCLAAVLCFSGFFLGFQLKHGGYIAFGALFGGVTLSCYLWIRTTRTFALKGQLDFLCALSFVLVAGLALYSNVAWALWAIGVPVDIGTVRDGRMSEHYWLGPFTLAYAAVSYGALRWCCGTSSRSE